METTVNGLPDEAGHSAEVLEAHHEDQPDWRFGMEQTMHSARQRIYKTETESEE